MQSIHLFTLVAIFRATLLKQCLRWFEQISFTFGFGIVAVECDKVFVVCRKTANQMIDCLELPLVSFGIQIKFRLIASL